MRVLTVKSKDVLDEQLQNEVHHTFGMEHYTDYVFKSKKDQKYSATIVLENTSAVIEKVVSASKGFPGLEFVMDDLDMENNSIERYQISEGRIEGQVKTGWNWEV